MPTEQKQQRVLPAQPCLVICPLHCPRTGGIQLQYLMVHLKTASWGGPQTPTCPLPPATPGDQRGAAVSLFLPPQGDQYVVQKQLHPASSKALLYTYLHLDRPSQHCANSPIIPPRIIMIDFPVPSCLLPGCAPARWCWEQSSPCSSHRSFESGDQGQRGSPPEMAFRGTG